MNQRSRLIIISFLSGSVMLQGCTSVKKTLGIERDAPDEFSVTPCTQPLDMPPDFFTLPKPVPGKPRPQEVRAMEAEKEKLIGSTQSKGTLSPGQKAILEMAGAEAGQDDIRRQVDNESRIEKAEGQPVLEQLGIKKAKPKGKVINPQDEAHNLQRKGIPQIRPVAQD